MAKLSDYAGRKARARRSVAKEAERAALRLYWKSQIEDGSSSREGKAGRFAYREGKAGRFTYARQHAAAWPNLTDCCRTGRNNCGVRTLP